MILSLTDMLDRDELVRLLEPAHPDPYSAGGGALTFHPTGAPVPSAGSCPGTA
jgi:hypothetical protein